MWFNFHSPFHARLRTKGHIMRSWIDMKRLKQGDRMKRYQLESTACLCIKRCITIILEAKIIPLIRQMIGQINFSSILSFLELLHIEETIQPWRPSGDIPVRLMQYQTIIELSHEFLYSVANKNCPICGIRKDWCTGLCNLTELFYHALLVAASEKPESGWDSGWLWETVMI